MNNNDTDTDTGTDLFDTDGVHTCTCGASIVFDGVAWVDAMDDDMCDDDTEHFPAV